VLRRHIERHGAGARLTDLRELAGDCPRIGATWTSQGFIEPVSIPSFAFAPACLNTRIAIGSGVRVAHPSPEPMPLFVHNADRRRLLRHVRSDIVRHSNLRWCRPPDDDRPDRGTTDGLRRDYPRSTDGTNVT
jgi:hypothetical protein